jgi:hypothetical protein
VAGNDETQNVFATWEFEPFQLVSSKATLQLLANILIGKFIFPPIPPSVNLLPNGPAPSAYS